MTKKHFKECARIIKSISVEEERSQIAYKFALMFKQHNERFSTDIFLKACGVDPDLGE
jgi:hypothetical protein